MNNGSEKAQEAWKDLASLAATVEPQARDRAGFLAECRSGRLDGVSVAYRTFESIQTTGRIDEELVAALQQIGLRFIAQHGMPASLGV